MNRAVGMDWLDDAACSDMDPELFFPPKGSVAPRAHAEAKTICADCPVRMECLEYALANNEQWGIWGGTGERERRRIRAQRRRASAA